MDLARKVALIIGGARMGRAIGAKLASRGCDLALSYRSSRAEAEKTAGEFRSMSVRCETFKADVSNQSSTTQLFKKIRRAFPRLDIIVNLASVYEGKPWSSLGEDDFDVNIDGNLRAAYLVGLLGSKQMTSGRIIHFCDWVAASGRPRYKGFSPYYIAKMGVLGVVQSQALELAPNILVNAVAPGPILPPKGASQKEINAVEKETPLGRWGGPEEIAKAVLFLCETDFVTGECIRVDGGRHLY